MHFEGSPALDDLREYLGLIRSEAFRCKSITNGSAGFQSHATVATRAVNLADVINSAARLLSHQKRGGQVEFQIEIADDLPPVSGDAGQLQQAIIALATNALDAMPDGGVLTIISAQRMATACLIEVSDTGVGIPPENIAEDLRTILYDQGSRDREPVLDSRSVMVS